MAAPAPVETRFGATQHGTRTNAARTHKEYRMADEATDALIPEAPSPVEAAAPTEAPAHDPFEKRYNDLRSDYDRKNSLLDRATKGDIEAIQELGFAIDESESTDPTPDYDDDPVASELAALRKDHDELKAWRAQQEAETTASRIATHVDELAGKEGVTLTDADKEYIFSRAAAGERIGPEQTEAAFKAHLAYRDSLRQAFEEEYIPTKRASRPGAGQAASKQPDLDNPQERVAYMQSLLHGDQAA